MKALLKWLHVKRTTHEQSGDSMRGSRGFKIDVLIDRREIIDTYELYRISVIF